MNKTELVAAMTTTSVNHEVCDLLMKATKANSRVACQFIRVRDLMKGQSKRTDVLLDDERAKLARLVDTATSATLALNKQVKVLGRFYDLTQKSERLALCLDTDCLISDVVDRMFTAERQSFAM